MRYYVGAARAEATLMLLLMLSGVCLAGTWDFNPGMYAIKHRHDYQESVEGAGYVMEYQRINTNNLSLLEYMHGSGSFKEAALLTSEQKSTGSPDTDYYWIYDPKYGGWVKKIVGASSAISYTKQNDAAQSPYTFAYGTGYYARNPVGYNSLLKDRTVARSYQEATVMEHQLEYARGFVGDIAVELNCTSAKESTYGRGLTSMRIKDRAIEGTVHVGELLTDTLYKSRNEIKRQGIKQPLVELDLNYIGSFDIEKSLKVEVQKSYSKNAEDWLPCCSGGYFDLYDYEKLQGGERGIFDCSCRNSSLATFKPGWDGTAAQFPLDRYQTVP